MKYKVPGAESSTGVKPVDFTLPAGDYVVELAAGEVKESAKSPCLLHRLQGIVLDGPDDPKTGKSTQGRKWFHQITQLLPEHDSYKENDTRAADEIADLCGATGVDIDEEGYDPEELAGKRVHIRVGIRMGKDEAGNDRPENTLKQQKDDEGHVHLYLSDDGKPLGSPKNKGPRAGAGARGKR